MERNAILRKVKACLRLAASSNPNEAAAALRQAQTMMRIHGITHAEAMDVDEAEVNTRARGAEPARSILLLANLAADGFGAQLIVCREKAWSGGSTVIRFYGCDGASEIAAFAFTVLRRQLDTDRLKHIARVRKRGNREARGEVFALAWVNAVERLFPEADIDDGKRLSITQFMRARYPEAGTSSGRDLTTRGKTRDDDALAGHVAGLNAKLHRGVKGKGAQALEHLS
ncbi:DUF2786 domain-containing protein [Dyella sp. 20L07]|uniref:DUF2786 domain-containing protein n=1 Tax=Dyella sp. 20L07 TaxID=3384240 RepID=UPI003D28AA63